MSDNSGMNGVEVALQAADGTTLVPLTGNPSPVTPHPYKIIEDEHVVIIRNGERFDITGRKLE